MPHFYFLLPYRVSQFTLFLLPIYITLTIFPHLTSMQSHDVDLTIVTCLDLLTMNPSCLPAFTYLHHFMQHVQKRCITLDLPLDYKQLDKYRKC